MSSWLTKNRAGYFQNDWEFAVPHRKASLALRALDKFIKDNDLNFPVIGIFLRFGLPEDKSLIAHTTALSLFKPDEPLLFVEFPTPTPLGFPKEMENAINHPFNEIAHMLMTEFEARPHWAKNQPWVFSLSREMNIYGDNLLTFNKIIEKLDPIGMFSNDFVTTAGLTNAACE